MPWKTSSITSCRLRLGSFEEYGQTVTEGSLVHRWYWGSSTENVDFLYLVHFWMLVLRLSRQRTLEYV